MEERLQKVMAHAGVASRRTCEEMIQQGRVRVNGKVVSELGTKVDPERDIVLVDGNPITGSEAPRYIVLYKPRGHLSSMEPEGAGRAWPTSSRCRSASTPSAGSTWKARA